MANWVEQSLKIVADSETYEQIKEFVKFETEDGKTLTLCEEFFPVPKELLEPKRIISGHQRLAYLQNPDQYPEFENGLTQAEFESWQQNLVDKFKTTDSWQWRIENWGCSREIWCDTPWNDYDQQISFQTAWSPPLGIITELSKHFPEATFILEYVEPGEGYYGTAVFKAGDCQDDCHDMDWQDDELDESLN